MDFKEKALESIKRKHHHDDGTEVVLNEVSDDGVGKIIEDEYNWKMRTQEPASSIVESSDAPKPKAEEIEELPKAKKQKEVMASCNCGKLFEAGAKDDGMVIKTFDAAGNVTGSYTVAGSSGESYSVAGSSDKSYEVSGSAPDDYK